MPDAAWSRLTRELAPISLTSVTPPTAVLFDVGDTLLVERRFDLEAGLAAVVPQSDAIPALAKAFRTRVRACHETHTELRLASWLRRRLRSLSRAPVDEIEDCIWSEVVTLSPSPGVIDVLQRLARDGVPMATISNAAFSGRVLLASSVATDSDISFGSSCRVPISECGACAENL